MMDLIDTKQVYFSKKIINEPMEIKKTRKCDIYYSLGRDTCHNFRD